MSDFIRIPMVYDCFNFFNELDILEMRLNILSETKPDGGRLVDYFVIVESSVTHSGEPKPYYYEDNKDRFKEFWDRIIHVKIDHTPNDFINLPPIPNTLEIYEKNNIEMIYDFISKQTRRFNRYNQPDYGRDFYQKECVRIKLADICDDDDIVIISDADEIPNPEILKDFSNLNNDKIYSLNQPTYYYYLNVLKETTWYGSKISRYKNIKDISFNEVRGDDSLSEKLPNGGWHFSFMGGKEMVEKKLTSYSARDMVNSHVLNSIGDNMNNGIDPFFRNMLNTVNIDDTYPKYLLDNIEKYKHMIKY